MQTDWPKDLSRAPVSISDAKTVLVPPPPTGRKLKGFEYQESGYEEALSTHAAQIDASGFDTQPITQMEAQDLTRTLRRIYLRIFGKGGMIL